LVHEYLEQEQSAEEEVRSEELLKLTHRTIERVSRDLEELGFNTAIAALMEYVNELYKLRTTLSGGETWKSALEVLVKLLAPFAPHISEELWEAIGQEGSVHTSEWPAHDEKYLTSDTMTIVVQINGKVRDNIEVPAGSTEEDVVTAAKNSEKVKTHLSGEPKKTIYVPNKLISFVV
jgi:leucyl-tRNA synthetase